MKAIVIVDFDSFTGINDFLEDCEVVLTSSFDTDSKYSFNGSLKPMPQKHMTEKENMSSTCIKWYDKGYNRCIDEILGDTE